MTRLLGRGGLIACLAVATPVVILGLAHYQSTATPARQTGSGDGRLVKFSEDGLRRLATKKPMPEYPADSLAHGASGVAIADITTDANGNMSRVQVVDAPDAAIAAAVQKALMQWTFSSVTVQNDPSKTRLTGKLMFYFTIENGKGLVLFPDQAAAKTTARDAHAAPAGDWTILDEKAAAEALKTKNTMVVDVRDRTAFKRDHRAGAVNLPSDELTTRAGTELKGATAIIVDCTRHSAFGDCRAAAGVLREVGFQHISILGNPKTP